jgi:hypothetical protein
LAVGIEALACLEVDWATAVCFAVLDGAGGGTPSRPALPHASQVKTWPVWVIYRPIFGGNGTIPCIKIT